jgi:hypothetical protein
MDSKILNKIKRNKDRTVFTPGDFLDLGSRIAVDQALHRLVKAGKLRRLARGLYDVPRVDPEIGSLSPTIEAIVEALKGRDHIRMQASGGYAANLLGLSDQVPVKVVFLTDGPSRRLQVGGLVIVMKRTTPKNMATAGRVSGLVIQALRHLGQRHVDGSIIQRLRARLSATDRQTLRRDARFAPAWIAAIMKQVAASGEK